MRRAAANRIPILRGLAPPKTMSVTNRILALSQIPSRCCYSVM